MSERTRLQTVEEVLGLVGDDHTFWTVSFTKRTNGEERTFTGRRHVRRHLRGGTLPYNRREKRLVGIWIPEQHRRENQKDNGYRNIPVEGIHELKAHGRVWDVEDGYATERKTAE